MISIPLNINIVSSPYWYDIPEGVLLDQIAVQTDVNQSIIIEIESGTADIFSGVLDLAKVLVLIINKKSKIGPMRIYFRDFTNPINVKLYLK